MYPYVHLLPGHIGHNSMINCGCVIGFESESWTPGWREVWRSGTQMWKEFVQAVEASGRLQKGCGPPPGICRGGSSAHNHAQCVWWGSCAANLDLVRCGTMKGILCQFHKGPFQWGSKAGGVRKGLLCLWAKGCQCRWKKPLVASPRRGGDLHGVP